MSLRTTVYRRLRSGPASRRAGIGAAAAVVIAAAAVGLAACGSSSSTTTTAAITATPAVAAWQKQANAICVAASKGAQPLTSRMAAAEKAKQLPTLADTTALVAAQAELQQKLAALNPPAEAKALADQANKDFAQLVARSKVLLAQHGRQAIAYDAVDANLNHVAVSLDALYKNLGLTNCA